MMMLVVVKIYENIFVERFYSNCYSVCYVTYFIFLFYFNKKIFRVIFYHFIDKYENTLMSYELLISVL